MSNRIHMLESEYRKTAEAFGKSALQGDANAMNRNFKRLNTIRPKIKAWAGQGEVVLCRLMKDGSDSVAFRAAIDCLPFAEAKALEVLDTIAKKNGPIAFGARMTAMQWRAGKLKIR